MSLQTTFVGNVTSEPELRFTQGGVAVASFTVAVSKRVKNGDKWEDGPTSFARCSVWRQYAENVAETLTKGMRVIVTGTIAQREYDDKDGTRKSVWEVQVEDVGPALRYATAKVSKVSRDGFTASAGDDPWASPAQPNLAEVPF